MKINYFKTDLILVCVIIITGISKSNLLEAQSFSQSESELALNTEGLEHNAIVSNDIPQNSELEGVVDEDVQQKIQYHDPGFKEVVQIAIVVKDIEKSSKLWGELLGMPVPEIRTTRPGNEVKVIYRGKPSMGQAKLTFFVLGKVVIELLEPVGEGTAWKEFLDEKGEGVQHIGFQVMDQDKTTEAFEHAGYPVIHSGRYDSDDGTYIYYDTQEALGVVIESLHSDGRK